MESAESDQPERHPVDMSHATTKEHYITGMVALNMFDERSGEEGGVAD